MQARSVSGLPGFAALLVTITVMLGAAPALAQCVANFTIDMAGQTSGGTGVLTSVAGNCAAVRTGIYKQQNADVGNNYPVSGTGGTGNTSGDAGLFTTSKATYKVVLGAPIDDAPLADGYADSYRVSIDSLVANETGGTDSFQMYYSPTSDAAARVFGSATQLFTVNIINLPANGPTVTAISPTSAPLGGSSVVITGTGFIGTTGAAGVKFGALNATSYTVDSATQITATAPGGSAGTVDVTVTNATITSPITAADQYTYVAAPTVTSLSPTAGPEGSGTTVIISGTALTNATAVSFGGTPAVSFTVNSAVQITAVAPAGSGVVDVSVTTVGGTSATSAADRYTYVPLPTVASLSPSSGPTASGTTVVLTGSNLSGATAVTFGATSAVGFTINSASQITAVAPAGSGTVNVRVTTTGGTSAAGAGNQFTYVPAPTVAALSPVAGPLGGTAVVITGTNLSAASAVTFGGNPATSYSVDSNTQISALAPAGSAGTVNVQVTTIGGTSAIGAGNQFTYVTAPAVTSLSPAAGPESSGASVVITGTGLSGATAVSFGATAAVSFTVNSATQITAIAPAGSGTVDVRVTTAGGTSPTGAGASYTYVVAPAVTALTPASGPLGGTSVTLTGSGFSAATAVSFGANPATSFTVDSATQITAIAPAGSAGAVNVRVTTAGGTSPTGAGNVFTYVAAPAVTALAPASGPLGGVSVVITGTDLLAATAVTFGATAASSYTVNSATQITATAPAGSAGTVNVQVTTVGGTSATGAGNQFTYFAAPAVASIAPAAGPLGGATSVVITGSNLTGVTAVTFGATPATGFTVNSATQITATSPGGSGTVDVQVTSPGGSSAISAADRFTYVAAPVVTALSPGAGPTASGASVTITGTGFSNATAVVFGATTASFTVNSATSITAISPGGSGTVDVRVTTAGGTSATSGADQYTFVVAPAVTAISPTSGPASGNTTVAITGTGFIGATSVSFGAVPAASFTINSATSITAVSPSGTGAVDIRVTTVGGASAVVAADQFTYVGPPTVSSIAPAVGPVGGGTSVAITGTNFSGVTAVTFGATPATSYTVNSTTLITAVAPAGSGTVDVRVTATGGTTATSAGDQFTYVAAPTVSGISPPSGPALGGTTVTITGTGFSLASAVVFGARNATSFTVNSATSITAVSPGDSGVVDVRVFNPGGTSATSAADQFTYVPAPVVSAVTPPSGPAAGATVVTITGSNLAAATAVTFGTTPATAFTVNSATQITATAPAGSGVVDVRVTTTGGTSATGVGDRFSYIAAPTVSAVSPIAGPLTGGTTVTITGTDLSAATAVVFGAAPASSFTVNSATSITAVAPAGTGTVDIRVTTGGGTSAATAADQFSYLAVPVVASISPASGPSTGGTAVTLTGTGFGNATAVAFGATPATSFTVNSASSITATSPTGSGTADVRVTTAGGTSAVTAADRFTFIPVPTVTALAPASGPAAGGTAVTITGTNLTGASAVVFGAVAATTFTVNSATSITATSPAGSGIVDVTVTTTGGTTAVSAADRFAYIAVPTISAVSPNAGPLAGGTSVTITGSNLTAATAVTFGAAAATSFTVNSATSITATSPAGSGTVDIRVTTVGGTSAASAADQFAYAALPTVAAVSPNSGPAPGGTAVTITGTGFTGTAGAGGVKFGTVNAASYTVNSATSITAVAPAGSGTVDIRIAAPGGSSAASAADQFTYLAAPVVTSIAPANGPATGGTSITISGSGFAGTTGSGGVRFGTSNATSYTVNSATSITAAAPPGTGIADVTVTNNGQTSAVSAADQFTYNAAPVITAVSPGTGPAGGGTAVTITGSGFTGTSGPAGVRFGSANAASYTVTSASSITAQSPAGTGIVDIVVTNAGQSSAISAADRFAYTATTTQTAVASSQNPSNAGQSVTFTATVTSTGGTPSGSVTFNDGGTTVGTAALSAGVASFSTTTLAVGAHSITAVYAGNASFAQSTSPALLQTVNIPLDSVRLRAMQLNVTKLIAQNSGQAMSGAIFDAISEGFSEDGTLVMPGQNGVRINFAADPRDDDDAPRPADGLKAQSNGYGAGGSSVASRAAGRGRASSSRIEDAFAALERPMPRKAPPRWREQKQWLLWADIRTTGVDRWSSSTVNGISQTGQSSLYGNQVNALLGLTYKAAPNFLVGFVGGWETFNYTQQDINGRLKGDGWTAGAYLGWLLTPALRYDAALTYSGIGYDGAAGAARGTFSGERWMFATGLTGSHEFAGFLLEPSLRVYTLFEHQNAYVDTLGTAQGTNDFATGRASAGLKAAYPFAWLDDIVLTPYLGVYGDYYFTEARAEPLAGIVDPLASTPLLQGWSARASGGLGSKFSNGAGVLLGGELGGIGSNTRIWTLSAKARVPF